jgi:hypothetical protein
VKKLHLSDLDEFLANAILESVDRPLKLAIRKEGNQGYVFARLLTLRESEGMPENGVDFELSPCECMDFSNMEVSDFLGKPVFTSSAYELLDFIFMFIDRFECLIDFEGNAWKIKILNQASTCS